MYVSKDRVIEHSQLDTYNATPRYVPIFLSSPRLLFGHFETVCWTFNDFDILVSLNIEIKNQIIVNMYGQNLSKFKHSVSQNNFFKILGFDLC